MYILYKNHIVNIFLYFSCRYSDEQDFWLCYTSELCISFCFMAVIQYIWYFYLSIKFIVELCVFILSESFALLSAKTTRKEQDLIAKYRVIKLLFEMKIMYWISLHLKSFQITVLSLSILLYEVLFFFRGFPCIQKCMFLSCNFENMEISILCK